MGLLQLPALFWGTSWTNVDVGAVSVSEFVQVIIGDVTRSIWTEKRGSVSIQSVGSSWQLVAADQLSAKELQNIAADSLFLQGDQLRFLVGDEPTPLTSLHEFLHATSRWGSRGSRL
jgi:hypothetical protein